MWQQGLRPHRAFIRGLETASGRGETGSHSTDIRRFWRKLALFWRPRHREAQLHNLRKRGNAIIIYLLRRHVSAFELRKPEGNPRLWQACPLFAGIFADTIAP